MDRTDAKVARCEAAGAEATEAVKTGGSQGELREACCPNTEALLAETAPEDYAHEENEADRTYSGALHAACTRHYALDDGRVPTHDDRQAVVDGPSLTQAQDDLVLDDDTHVEIAEAAPH